MGVVRWLKSKRMTCTRSLFFDRYIIRTVGVLYIRYARTHRVIVNALKWVKAEPIAVEEGHVT